MACFEVAFQTAGGGTLYFRQSDHLRRNYCAASILLEIALEPQIFLNGCAAACAASISAILIGIAQEQFEYD